MNDRKTTGRFRERNDMIPCMFPETSLGAGKQTAKVGEEDRLGSFYNNQDEQWL